MSGFKKITKNILLALLNLFFPKHCQGCNKPLNYRNRLYICRECIKEIELIKPPICLKCGSHVTGDSGLESICGKCCNIDYKFDRAYACCIYNGLIKKLIHDLKYKQKKYIINIFNHILEQFANDNKVTEEIDLVIPIPLHKSKLSQRGFNQSLLLAQHLSKTYDLPLSSDNLLRIRKTGQQVKLSKKERKANIRNAFSIKNEGRVKEKSIMLVDDVLTTAATANEASFVLKEAGAKTITLFTLARGS